MTDVSETASPRAGGRGPAALRPLTIVTGAMPNAEGSVLLTLGNTRVICAATVEERLPRWLVGQRRGWVTAEYSMLPRATAERTTREAVSGKQGGRTVEIQRLIGRSLRAVIDLGALGERQITVDCDVLQADGGTRCASITGGYVALALAIQHLRDRGLIKRSPLRGAVAAISVGVVRGRPLLDLDYAEDATADVDANIVMTADGRFVELQSTAEREPFTAEALASLLQLARAGLDDLFRAQQDALADQG
jgi:ribonuclease PH